MNFIFKNRPNFIPLATICRPLTRTNKASIRFGMNNCKSANYYGNAGYRKYGNAITKGKALYTTGTGTGTGSSKQKDDEKSTTWYAIPVSVGIVYIGLMQLYKISQRPDDESILFAELKTLPLYLRVYASLPLRYISQCWGYINNLTLPVWARSPIYKTYTYLFGCNLEEMEAPEGGLEGFENLGQFFYRSLKKEARPLSKAHLVSPCDGKILYCGKVSDGRIENVKGKPYKLTNLMGPPSPSKSWSNYFFPTKSEQEWNGNLYYAVIYLAPGDYHKFHAPTHFTISYFRHYTGEMFSVSPFLVRHFPTLFTLNERVSCVGTWKFGRFGMTAVAATNVGKIELGTNVPEDVVTHGTPKSVYKGVRVMKGEKMGGFKLGSTVVLVFEAPEGWEFGVGEGDGVKMGQAIGNL